MAVTFLDNTDKEELQRGIDVNAAAIERNKKDLQNEIEVERARVTNLSTLPEGSTAGDAELADIKVGYDGTIYPNAGEAVRRQAADINAAFDIVRVHGNNILNPYNSEIGAFSETDANLVVGKPLVPFANPGRWRSKEVIPIDSGAKRIYFRTSITEDTTASAVYIYFLDNQKGFMYTVGASFIDMIKAGNNPKSEEVPTGCAYIHVAVGGANTGHDFSKVCLSYDHINAFEDFKMVDKVRTLKESVLPEKVAPTRGKKMLVFGDSNTETAKMDNDGGNYNPNFRFNFPVILQEMLQAGSLKNYGKAGATLRDTGYEYNEQGELVPKNDTVLYRMNLSEQVDLAIEVNDREGYIPDIIIISVGSNDSDAIVNRPDESRDTYAEAMSIKSLDEFNYEARTTMHKALRYAMWRLRDAYPEAKCFMATPLQRTAFEIPQYTIDTIIAMAKRYNFKIVDTYSESGIIRETCYPPKWADKNADNDPLGIDSSYDLYDGLHTSRRGANKLASLYASVILSTYLHEEYATKSV